MQALHIQDSKAFQNLCMCWTYKQQQDTALALIQY